MPFRSESQRRYLWAKHPEIARRWSEEYGSKPVIPPAKKAPPFMKGKPDGSQDKAREAGTEAAKRRLAKMRGNKKPEVQ